MSWKEKIRKDLKPPKNKDNKIDWSIAAVARKLEKPQGFFTHIERKPRSKSTPIEKKEETVTQEKKQKPKTRAKSTETVPRKPQNTFEYKKIKCKKCGEPHSTFIHNRIQESENPEGVPGDYLAIPTVSGGKKRRKSRKKRKPRKKRKKTKKKRGRKSSKKYNKCVKFFTKRHRVTKKKALKLCKMMFG